MALPVIPNVARVALKFTGSANPPLTVNVMHIQKASGDNWPTLAPLVAHQLETTVNSDVGDVFKPISSAYGLSEMDFTPLDGSSGTIPIDNTGRSWPACQGSGDSLPQVAALIKMTTALRGRRHRGRLYLGPISEGVTIGEGVLAGAVITDTTASWVAYLDHLVTNLSAAVVIASYVGRSAEQVTNIACERLTATQRRRQHR